MAELLIGAHTSSAGGVHNALLAGKSIGATTIQLFTSNQRQWKSKELSEEVIAKWKEALEETGLKKIMSHDSYLINLGSPREEVCAKSKVSFLSEIRRCHALEISYLNFHPGAALDGDRQECLDRIIKNLLPFEKELEGGPTRLLIETTAGQGSTVGCTFEEIAYLLEGTTDRLPIGVCVDTCHIFAAGYDLSTKKACEETFAEFDRIIGLKHLYGFHLNDSIHPVGSRKDRHRPLGEGEIGKECFKWLMQEPRMAAIPKYLETPGGLPRWEDEIVMLKRWAKK